MYLSIIHIRIKQLYRGSSGLGLFRSLFVAGLLTFLLLALFTQFLKPGWGNWITAGYLFAMLSLHIKRPDKQFLKINIADHHFILVIEYLLISTPLLFCQIYFQLFELLIITLGGLMLMPFVNYSFQRKGLNNRIIQAIPNEAFEWKSGIRKYFIFLMIVWLTGISTSWHTSSVPIAIVILGLMMVNFFELGEPLSILMSPELNPNRFLFRKIIVAQKIISFMLLPLVLIFTLFHSELWYVPIIEYVLISFILWYAIFLKYAFYKPNTRLMAGQLFTAIGAMSLFLPFLIPLTWILTIRFYFKSISNLKPYLNDFN